MCINIYEYVLIYQSLCIIRLSEHHHGSISWGKLKEILTTEGEKLEQNDLHDFLSALIGDVNAHLDDNEFIDSRTFATKILGFEENY